MIRPDRNILTAAQLLTAIAQDVEKARRHLTLELRYQDGTPTSASGADSQGGRGERTTKVDEDCTGILRCTWTKCPDGDGSRETHTHPCPQEGEHTHRVAVPVTIVEQAAINRQHITNIRDDLNAHINGILVMTNNLAQTCTQILGLRFETPRCTATGRDGAIEWADPTCVSVPSRGPLCDRCSKAEYRWRVAHNMPARTDGLFTGEPAA